MSHTFPLRPARGPLEWKAWGHASGGLELEKAKEREGFKGAKTNTKKQLPFLGSALSLNVALGSMPIWDFCTDETFARRTPNSTRWRVGGNPGS